RAEGTDHERYALGHRRFAEVADPQIDVDSGQRRAPCTDLEHPPGRVDADDANAVRGDRHGDPARPDSELDDRAAGAAGLPRGEGDALHPPPTPRGGEVRNR